MEMLFRRTEGLVVTIVYLLTLVLDPTEMLYTPVFTLIACGIVMHTTPDQQMLILLPP